MGDFGSEFDSDDETDEPTYRLRPPESSADENPPPEIPNDANDCSDLVPPTHKRKRKRKRPHSQDAAVPAASPGKIGDPQNRPDPAVVTLVSSFWYPLTGNGVRVILSLTVLVALAFMIPIPIVDLIVRLIAGMFVALLFLETANFTLEQIPAEPRFPLIGRESIPAAMYGLTTLVIARIPQILGFVIMVSNGKVRKDIMMSLLATGLVYVPMGFLALAELQNERGLNPILVFRGMKRMGAVYFALVAVAVTAFLVPSMLMVYFKVPGIPQRFLSTMLLLYATTALMRAVAIVFRQRGIDFE